MTTSQYLRIFELGLLCYQMMNYGFSLQSSVRNRPYLNHHSGGLILCNEIARGEYGNWKVVDMLEWIMAISVDSNREAAIV